LPAGHAALPVPTFVYQMHDDLLTEPGDVQAMFDNILVADKKLQWIRGTTPDGTATWSSSAALSQCSGGTPPTCARRQRGRRGTGERRLFEGHIVDNLQFSWQSTQP
jgi:hypothetical protein